MSNAGATTITVNTSLFAAGDTLFITNIGAGACTITAGTATVSTASSLVLAQYDSGTLYFTSAGVSIWQKYQGAAAAGGSTYVGASVSASAVQSIANATEVLLTWNTEQFDTDSIHDNSTNTGRMTVPAGKGGKWLISGTFSGSTNGTTWEYIIAINGTSIISGFPQFSNLANSRGTGLAVPSYVVNLSAADYVTIYATQTSGGAINFDGTRSRFQFSYLGA
jgi:hypothetical protein